MSVQTFTISITQTAWARLQMLMAEKGLEQNAAIESAINTAFYVEQGKR